MLRIATYNVNSIRQRLHILIPWLKENEPDIICMQETKVENNRFPSADFHRVGYHVVFFGSKGRNGVAIASLEEPKNVKFGLDSEPRDEDRIIVAEIGNITVVNTYIPQGFKVDSEKYAYKLQWLDRLKKFFEKNLNLDSLVAWCGDMNVAPDDIDVHSPDKLRNHVCFHEAARNAYKKILEMGFIDLLRKHHPNERIYTFFDYRVKGSIEKGLGWRVDSINVSKKLADRSIDCYVDMKPRLAERPSDHTILVADFEI
ncbi:MAG: exodeoxyribonuclease III [Archaeoglobaceae archaeon]